MTLAPPAARTERRLLLAILALAVILRLGAAVLLGDGVTDLPGVADQISYHNLAQRLLAGHGLTFGEPWWPHTPAGAQTAHWSYLYTGYLALIYALVGPHALVARLVQALIVGVLHPLLAYLIGRRLFGTWAGLLAALLTAGYAYFVYYAASLMTEPFYIAAILASIWLALRLADATTDRERLRLALVLGLTIGAAVLLRQLVLLLIPFLLGWIALAGKRQLLALGATVAVLLALILPFTAFNYTRFHRFVLLNTNAGFAFFWGNHPIYGDHFIPILPSAQYQELIPAELKALDEAALDSALLGRGVGFVLADPGRYLRLSLSRIPFYFMFWPSPDSSRMSNLTRVASFGLLWPFMLLGLILAGRGAVWRLRPPSPYLLLLGFVLVYTAMHLLTWTLVRYRLPVDAVGLIFAGLALERIGRWLWGRRAAPVRVA
jgi:4-amino-4-deoxy-L-arabinose transferase-like glycosyltransferase